MIPYSEFIFQRTYARWIEDAQRRETWEETVVRYLNYMSKLVPENKKAEFAAACHKIMAKQVMPSMRALWSAGPALERDNIAAYNCAYTELSHPKAFAEILYILMNGTGVGYSVERQFVNKFDPIPNSFTPSETPIVFADSKRGWAEGLYTFLKQLWKGIDPVYDLSKIRPEGAPLKTFGGRASGPGPLRELLEFTRRMFHENKGNKLNSLQCHDLACMVARSVIVGGVRRSACISLSNLTDDRMAKCKSGEYPIYRSYSNNSVAYTEKPDSRKLISEWLKLMESRAGERGIFNRVGAKAHMKQVTPWRDTDYDFGCNPCGEILLRPFQFCNLTEVVVRPGDMVDTLHEKVKAATILGVVQSTLTDFKFLNHNWKYNCEQERLLGVSLTGLMDHPILSSISTGGGNLLKSLRDRARVVAAEWANALGINPPAAITCIKPSGTVSKLVDCAPGVHPRYSRHHIQRVRISERDPLARMMVDQGVPVERAMGEPSTLVLSFPLEAPPTSVFRNQMSAIQQLNYISFIKKNWCDHNVSATIYVKDNEWTGLLGAVDSSWDDINGLTFLPYDNGVYAQAPYEEIDHVTYNRLVAEFPTVDFTQLPRYETKDQTTGAHEFACDSDKCAL